MPPRFELKGMNALRLQLVHTKENSRQRKIFNDKGVYLCGLGPYGHVHKSSKKKDEMQLTDLQCVGKVYGTDVTKWGSFPSTSCSFSILGSDNIGQRIGVDVDVRNADGVTLIALVAVHGVQQPVPQGKGLAQRRKVGLVVWGARRRAMVMRWWCHQRDGVTAPSITQRILQNRRALPGKNNVGQLRSVHRNDNSGVAYSPCLRKKKKKKKTRPIASGFFQAKQKGKRNTF